MFSLTIEPGRGVSVTFAKSDIHHHAALITFADEPAEPAKERLSRLATLRVHCGQIRVECRPCRPDPNPVKTIALHLVQIGTDELFRRAQSPVIANAVEKSRFAIERKARAVNAQFGRRRTESEKGDARHQNDT